MAKIADQIDQAPESYTTESAPAAETAAARPVLNVSGAAVGRRKQKKLKVYAGPEHPHAAQQPKPYTLTQVAQ